MRRLEQLSFGAMGTACSATVTMAAPRHLVGRAGARGRRGPRSPRASGRSRASCPASDLSRLNAASGDWVAGRRAAGRRTRGGTRRTRRDRRPVRPRRPAGADRGRLRPLVRAAAPAPARPPATAGARARRSRSTARRGRARLEPGAAVDLGGIGKGFAAARGRRRNARRHGRSCPGALVDLGGDLAVRGIAPDGGPWRIAVADPHAPGERVGILEVTAGGVATSGRDQRRFGPGQAHAPSDRPGAPAHPAGPGPAYGHGRRAGRGRGRGALDGARDHAGRRSPRLRRGAARGWRRWSFRTMARCSAWAATETARCLELLRDGIPA